MKTNHILTSLLTTLKLSTEEALALFRDAEFPMTESRLLSLLRIEGERDFKLCTYEELGVFLDGLILFKRGPSPGNREADQAIPLTNNLILKKLRIALELKEPETEIIFALGEAELGKQALKSLFRKEEHKNFQACSDALLLSFLEGLDEYFYDGSGD